MKDDAGCDEVNVFHSEFVDDEENFQYQESKSYRLMNVTRDLRGAVTNQSMTQEPDLASEDPENCISDFVGEVSYKFQEFFCFKNRI